MLSSIKMSVSLVLRVMDDVRIGHFLLPTFHRKWKVDGELDKFLEGG